MIESSSMVGAHGTNHLETLRARMDLLQRVVVASSVSGQDAGTAAAAVKPQLQAGNAELRIVDPDNPAAGLQVAPESEAQVSQPSIPIGRSTSEFASGTVANPGPQPPGRGVVRDFLNKLFGL